MNFASMARMNNRKIVGDAFDIPIELIPGRVMERSVKTKNYCKEVLLGLFNEGSVLTVTARSPRKESKPVTCKVCHTNTGTKEGDRCTTCTAKGWTS